MPSAVSLHSGPQAIDQADNEVDGGEGEDGLED